MDKGFIALVVAGCLGSGACLGGLEAATRTALYRESLEDPGFYHLVDEVGDPVSELPNEPLR